MQLENIIKEIGKYSIESAFVSYRQQNFKIYKYPDPVTKLIKDCRYLMPVI